MNSQLYYCALRSLALESPTGPLSSPSMSQLPMTEPLIPPTDFSPEATNSQPPSSPPESPVSPFEREDPSLNEEDENNDMEPSVSTEEKAEKAEQVEEETPPPESTERPAYLPDSAPSSPALFQPSHYAGRYHPPYMPSYEWRPVVPPRVAQQPSHYARPAYAYCPPSPYRPGGYAAPRSHQTSWTNVLPPYLAPPRFPGPVPPPPPVNLYASYYAQGPSTTGIYHTPPRFQMANPTVESHASLVETEEECGEVQSCESEEEAYDESPLPSYIPQGSPAYTGVDADGDGSRLFADMFSRADTSEDGGLSFEEFQSHFQDDILSATEMIQLFKNMDLNTSQRIDLSELEEYFRQGYAPYARLFSAVAHVQQAMLRSLQHSHRVYPEEEPFERFRTRVFLSECQRQLQALEEPITEALRQLRQLSYQERGLSAPAPLERTRQENGVGYEVQENILRLREQVDSLSELADRLLSVPSRMGTPWMQEVVEEEEESSSHYIVVSRAMQVQPEMNLHFRDATRLYIQQVREEQGNQLVYVRKEVNENSFVVYEIWEDESYLAIHNHAASFRTYQKELVDCLEQPTTVHTLPLPASWWAC